MGAPYSMKDRSAGETASPESHQHIQWREGSMQTAADSFCRLAQVACPATRLLLVLAMVVHVTPTSAPQQLPLQCFDCS